MTRQFTKAELWLMFILGYYDQQGFEVMLTELQLVLVLSFYSFLLYIRDQDIKQ